MSDRLCVLTGATGHIGYALLKELVANNERVRILIRKDTDAFNEIDCEKVYGDVTDKSSLEKAFKDAECVFHLAGVIDINVGNDEAMWNVNVEGTKNVVAACKKCGVKKMIYASSVDAMHPLNGDTEMTETCTYSADGLDGVYARTKAVATQYVLDEINDDFEAVVALPSACIGPYDFKVSGVGIMVRMYMNKKFPVSLNFGMYNFVDVRDVARGMYSAWDNGRSGESYILAGETVSLGMLMDILENKTGIPATKLRMPLWLANIAGFIMEFYYRISKETALFTRYTMRKLNDNCNFNCEKAKKELGYSTMSAEKSFGDMVDWIKDYDAVKEGKKNEENCRQPY